MTNKRKKRKLNPNEVWIEEQLANYLGFEFIVGFTEGGAPFGIEKDWDELTITNEEEDIFL